MYSSLLPSGLTEWKQPVVEGNRHVPHHLPTQPSLGSLGNWLVVPIYFYLEVQWRLVPGPSGPAAVAVLVVMLEGA